MAIVVAFRMQYGPVDAGAICARFSALVLMIISTVALATIGIYTIPRGLIRLHGLAEAFYLPERCISCLPVPC